MFINLSNKSDTISVHVLKNQSRNNVLVKSFGSSRDTDEIEKIVSHAREFIQRQTGTYYNLFNQPTEQDLEGSIRIRNIRNYINWSQSG